MSDLWDLACANVDVLRFSTLFTAQQVPRYLADDAQIDAAVEWCRAHGITHVYLESFRSERVPPPELIERARERFREAGFLVSGCMTPMMYGRHSIHWKPFSCYSADETRSALRRMSEDAARLFDVVMIDDFLCSDCTCPDCRAARGRRTWAEFKCGMMAELSRTHIIEAGRAVNPNCEFIIKYPAWYEMYQERGYDVAAQSALFPRTWAGTETRGLEAPGPVAHGRIPQYQAYWLMRWLISVGQGKCGGGWYDTIDTDPRYYVEQGRGTVLGGAPECFLFNYGALHGEGRDGKQRGQQDLAALMAELPQHFELARLIRGKRPRGLLGWKPANSSPGADFTLHPLLGMAGFPLTAAHEFDPSADGFVFGCHVLKDPLWWDAVEAAMESGRPILVTPAFLKTIRPLAEGNRLADAALRERAVVVPELTERLSWPGMQSLPQSELDELRDRAMAGIGSFHAPHGVSLFLFGDDVAVIESFCNEPVECSLRLEGWDGFGEALRIPAAGAYCVSGGAAARITLPARSLLALRRL